MSYAVVTHGLERLALPDLVCFQPVVSVVHTPQLCLFHTRLVRQRWEPMTDKQPIAEPTQPVPFTLTTKQAARRYSISMRTLSSWRMAGMPCLMPSRRKVLFVTTESDAWVRTRFAIGRPKPTLQRIANSTEIVA